MSVCACVRACVRVCVCVRACVRVCALKIVSMDTVLRFTNTLIIIITYPSCLTALPAKNLVSSIFCLLSRAHVCCGEKARGRGGLGGGGGGGGEGAGEREG